MAINKEALRAALNNGGKMLYKDRESTPFFDLRKDEHATELDGKYEAVVRLVCPPDTDGFAYRIMHPNVGVPGKEPKTFTCANYIAEITGADDLNCIICDLLEQAKDPEIQSATMKWTEIKDRMPVKVTKPVSEVIKLMSPQQLLLFNVIEPQFYGETDAPTELQGLQKWWINKQSLVNRMFNLLKEFPEDYFTDPVEGHSIKVSFNRNAQAVDMYQVLPWHKSPLPNGVLDKADDASAWAPKMKPDKDIKKKLQEMIPSLEIE